MGDILRTSARTTGRAATALLLALTASIAIGFATAKPAVAALCDVIDLQIGNGSELDWGWTGYGHDLSLGAGGKISLEVVRRCSVAGTVCRLDSDCPGVETCNPSCDCVAPFTDPECEVYGPVSAKRCIANTEQLCQIDADCPSNQPCVAFLAPPIPISAANTPNCVTMSFQENLAGTLNVQTGALESSAVLRWRRYLGVGIAQPCPTCGAPGDTPQIGDTLACDGGPRDGQACTVGAVTPFFGGTSFDCPPNPGANVSGAGTIVPLDRLTTASQSTQAVLPCGGSLGDLHPSGGSAVCLDNLASCTSNADCMRCTGDLTTACSSNTDCTGIGSCAAAPQQPIACGVYCHCGFCEGDPTRPCNADAQCDVGETCEQSSSGVQQASNNACENLICGLDDPEKCCSAGDPNCTDPTDEVGSCTLAPYYGCWTNTDCASLGAGDCMFAERSCFEGVISRSGAASPLGKRCLASPGAPSCFTNDDCTSGVCTANTMLPVLSTIACTAGAASAGINAALGTPGPAAISLPASIFLEGSSSGCICGNNIVECAEHCDDGNAIDDDGCDSNCTATGCPNGIVTSGEECDDGDNVNGDGCDTNCTVSACGNGVAGFLEQCDDGNLIDADGCDSNCTFTLCGNGVTTPSTGEQCDDGNIDDGDGCSSGCYTEPVDPCLVVPTCIGLGAEGRASLSIMNSDQVGKDKLKWKWTDGEESGPSDFGDPTSAVTYRLCVIDSGATVASYEVPPSEAFWNFSNDDTKYKDKEGSAAGITQIKLRAGGDGRARIGLQARGASFVAPTPYSPGQMFHQAPSVTIRLVNSIGRCWESDFLVLTATRNSAEKFQAKAP